MKRILIILLIIPYHLMASDSLEVKRIFAIKTDLIAIPFLFSSSKYYSITVEKSVCKKQSMQFSFLHVTNDMDYEVFQTDQIILEYKFYFNKIGEGFFGGLYSKYSNNHEAFYERYDQNYNSLKPKEKLELEYKQQSLGGGVITGYQYCFNKHLLVELIAGIGIRKNFHFEPSYFDETHVNVSSLNKNNWELDGRVALNLGYRF